MSTRNTMDRLMFILVLLLCTGSQNAVAQSILYVDTDAAGIGDGSSWTDALVDLRIALSNAQGGDEIWVAEGIYFIRDTVTASFRLKSGVAVYGGFAGTERERGERDPKVFETILSGNDGFPTTVSVVTASAVDRSAILDGFTVTNGRAEADFLSAEEYTAGGGVFIRNGSPTLRNLTIRDNIAQRGGGLANFGGNPVLIGCAFIDNIAREVGPAVGGAIYSEDGNVTVYNGRFLRNVASGAGSGYERRSGNGLGGAMSIVGGSATLVNTLFAKNEVEGGPFWHAVTYPGSAFGGAVFARRTELTVVNSTFVGNRIVDGQDVEVGGGAMYFVSDSVDGIGVSATIVNSIFWANDMEEIAGDADASHSIVDDGYPGAMIYAFDPVLDSEFRLSEYSFAVDAGLVDALPLDTLDLDADGDVAERIPVDGLRNPRTVGAAVDLGYAEQQDPTSPSEADYYPMEVGNSWTYYVTQERHDAPPDTGIGLPREITEVLSVNDTLYYLVPHPNALADTLRDDGEGRIWARVLGKDVLLYDFTMQESEKYLFDWTSWPHDTYEVRTERNVTIDVVAGHFENCIRLTFDIPDAVDDERSFTFAPGVGMVLSSHWGEGTYLYEAVVDGKVISSLEGDVPALSQTAFAYPNPFRESTAIHFPDNGRAVAVATVYDILGRTVAKLSTTDCSPGGCAFRWDGGDAPNGLYFVVSDVGSKQAVSVVLSR